MSFELTFGWYRNVSSFFSDIVLQRTSLSSPQSLSRTVSLPSPQCFVQYKNVSSSLATTALTLESSHAIPLKSLGSNDCISVAAEKRRIIFLFQRAILRKMLQFSTLETTSTGQKVVNLGKMWSTAAFVRSTGWLISPASAEAISLQLQSDLLVVVGAVAFAILLVSELTFAKTLLAFTMILPTSNVWSSRMPDMSIHSPS